MPEDGKTAWTSKSHVPFLLFFIKRNKLSKIKKQAGKREEGHSLQLFYGTGLRLPEALALNLRKNPYISINWIQ